jgi:uncharacterized protein
MSAENSRFRFPFAVNAQAGRLQREPDYDAYIRQLILQVLFTASGERINRPDFGAGVRRLVFAPNGPGTASLAQTSVYQALTNWLGRLIQVHAVEAAAENEKLIIRVEYSVLQTREKRFLNIETTL